MKKLVVAIDGPAGAGKSTVAQLAAKELGYTYIDTGAMYRAVAWKVLQQGGEVTDEKILAVIPDIDVDLSYENGKTTAACRQAGLVIDEATAADLKGMLLDTGGGRTTLCDVRVETGERFALTVEPVSDEEIYKLVGEVCKGIFEKLSGEPSSNSVEFRPAEEVERALRNMAGLPRPARARKGAAAAPDPAAELAKGYDTLEAFTAEFAARLSLWRRSRRTGPRWSDACA